MRSPLYALFLNGLDDFIPVSIAASGEVPIHCIETDLLTSITKNKVCENVFF